VPIAQTALQSSGSGRNPHAHVSTSSLPAAGSISNSPVAAQQQPSGTAHSIANSSASGSPALGHHFASAFRLFTAAPATAAATEPSTAPPNKPLMAAPPRHLVDAPMVSSAQQTGGTSISPASTAAAVRVARAEFFDTRVSGRAEMWAAVKLVCELVERGERGDAQAVLDAAGGTCPSGTLWGRKGGCYDERGERYVVPIWCVGWPDGVPLEDDEDGSGEAEAEMEERGGKWKEGKGKERAVDDAAIKGREMRVRARLSHTARDVMVKSGEEDSVSMLMQRLRSSGEVSIVRWARRTDR
jgi:hypothetical protein